MAEKINAQNSEESEGSKSLMKREEKSQRRAEAAAKRAEARLLAAKEEAEEAQREADRNRVWLTWSQRQYLEKLEEEATRLRVEEENRKLSRRATNHKDYLRVVTVANTNQVSDIDEVVQLTAVDRLPQHRRIKVLFKAFKEAQLEKLLEEKPGLRQSQYDEVILKRWNKSPMNPLHHANGCGCYS